ncbi:Similar to LSM domain-containing protein 1-A; acc. no. Q6GQ67 [Pyronema omphalodes CBS 100304]|uniref:Similar to LSM domain-containing protein 1-A acc. no. Q6GQ67 n=1 Tax=Pyronema omphalodes (strain CBS 100304) TaxID=1076935 RepID=U4L9D3_PYROM|nr:Similar to LSM domain-containing protein 1-A; acc. no. Q6GQ67 [Pyronema omphalodes CBS 100304]
MAQTQQPYETPSPFLQGYINRTLRVTTTDDRFFIGDLKCTDRDRNLILASTSEYRSPSSFSSSSSSSSSSSQSPEIKDRHIGLVVIPGNVITKIEVEERTTGTGTNPKRGWMFGQFGSPGGGQRDPREMGII